MNKEEAKELGLKSYDEQDNRPGDNFIKIYANNVGLGVSNWDMSLTFGEIVGTNDKGQPIVEQKVKVNMSKEFVKALTNLLHANMLAYEKKFGEIKMINVEDMPEDLSVEELTKEKPQRSKKRSR
ncbi:MAG: DUF3467 domain-containing protein [Pyrinomonadaceae bacterium]